MKHITSIACMLLMATGLQASNLRVISWNITDAVPHSKAKFIADTAKAQKADILALQEVNVTPYFLLNDLIEALGDNWTYRVTESAKNTKQLAILWNTKTVRLKTTKVPNAGIIEETDIQLGDASSMPAQIGYFQKGAFDFFLINVNLLKASEDYVFKAEQAQVLHDWVSGKKKALSGTENDFIVAGTFNFSFPGEKVGEDTLTHPAFSDLEGKGLLNFTLKPTWKKDPSTATYIADWFDEPRLLDGFALSKAATRHHVAGSSKVLRLDQKFRDMGEYEDEVSDHLPVIAQFKTNFED